MNITEFSVRRPVTIIMIFVVIIGISATLLMNLAMDLYPSVETPRFSVWTRFPGAGPADVERNVTERLERSLSSSRGLVNMTSNSQFESSSITLEFAYGTDMDKAVNDAQVLLNRLVNSLPDGVTTPIVRRFDMSAMPIMRLVVRGNYPPDQLRIFAEDEIQPAIERIDGVAAAEVTGGTTQVVKVEVSLNRLAAFNLTLNDVSTSLKGQNVLSSGGNLRRGTREFQIMTQEELVSIEQIKRLAVKTINTGSGNSSRFQVIRIEDIADVFMGYNDNASRVQVNGQSGVYIQITVESGSNQINVSDRVQAALEDINDTLPQGITLSVLSDNTTMIRATLDQVYKNAFQGACLAMVILMLFLRNFKATLTIGFSIPISIMLTLMAMTIFGFTLNLMTLTGLIMGMCMTLDASIVIIENIHSYRERGAKSSIAAILGSREMFRAITTSTVTTVCVFIPLIIYRNDLKEMGLLFSDLIFTVVISLTVSLIVAITLVPSLSGAILKLNTRKQKPIKQPLIRAIDDKIESFLLSLEKNYKKALEYCLSHRLLILSLVVIILVFSFMQFGSIGMNMFVRMRTDDNITLNVALPRGTAIDVTEKTLFEIEEIVKREVQGYTNIVLTAHRSGNNQGNIHITLPPPGSQIDTPDDIIRKLTPLLNSTPGTRVSFRAGRGMGNTSPIIIAVGSKNYEALIATAEEIQHIIRNYLPEIEDPTINLDEGAPQLSIEIDRDRASNFGLSLSSIASEIRSAMDGEIATTMSHGNRLLNVQVRLKDEDRQGLPNLDAISVINRSGTRISLSNVASISEGRAPSSIRRERQERVLRVTGGLAAGIAATDMQRRLEQTIDERLVLREGVSIRYLGEATEIQSYTSLYILIITSAIFLIFGIMASQFESFVDPFIIFFSIPLLFIGVIWIYKFSGEAMTMFSIVGIIACVGVVINNGIVLVDYTNTLCARGMSVREACTEAGRRRLRPILMTSLTTILGMAPIAFFPGAGADSIQPIGKTFVGGLFVSTFMTIFVTPIMYSVLNSWRQKKAKSIVLEKSSRQDAETLSTQSF
ncbi:MAG: efflux RND transporter permease subunit [Treponema sp.]|nr:efflux RND transporter permease subunit [Treponema sp.]MCL2237134.1 efflux RND transporter permease subunit [Treponema sp.]